MMILRLVSLALSMIAFLNGASEAQTRHITIDARTTRPPIDLLIGTNAGPMAMPGSGADYTTLFHALGFRAIRTHDYYGPCDWMTIFPDWSADANLESSYRFAATDSIIARIVAGGFDPLFRLGSSWRGNRPEFTNDPPGTIRDALGQVTHVADTNDFKKFAEICRHIVMHYNDGWANGYHHGIRRWEIWNEPSLRDQFWSGTPVQFRRMFVLLLKTLKSHDPALVVGGPGQAGQTTREYFHDLIEYCATRGAPLDFYSWHSYGGMRDNSNPWDIGRKALEARTVLETHGYRGTQLYCDEWNAGLNARNFADSGRGAAFYAAALCYFVEGGVAETYQYRGDNHALGLVTAGGHIKVAAEVFRVWKMLVEGSRRIQTTGSDTTGFTLIATRSELDSSIRALIANFPDESAPVSLRFFQFTGNERSDWILKRRVIDDTRRLEVIDSTRITGSDTLDITFGLAPRSVQYIELSRLVPSTTTPPPDASAFRIAAIYPNPVSVRAANAFVTIRYSVPANGNLTVSVYDLLGRVRKVFNDLDPDAGMRSTRLDVSGLQPGIHILLLRHGNRSLARTLLVTD